MAWTYNATLYGPTDSRHEWVPAVSMLHCRYSASMPRGRGLVSRPGHGRRARVRQSRRSIDSSREKRAHRTGACLECRSRRRLTKTATCARWMRSGATLYKAKGGTLITEYSGNSDPEAQSGQRGSRIEHLRFGMPGEMVDALRTATGRDVLAACGVPPTLMVPNSDGTAQREAYRRFLHTALRPMARLMESELRMKLDAPDLRLDMGDLHAADSESTLPELRELRQGRGGPARRCAGVERRA